MSTGEGEDVFWASSPLVMSWICISGASASIRLLSGVPAGERVPSWETYERIAAEFG